MTTFDGNPVPHRNPFLRATLLLGHYADRHELILTVLFWSYVLVRVWTPALRASPGVWISSTLAVVLLATFLSMSFHAKHLCSRDTFDPRLFHPQQAVDDNLHTLRLYHRSAYRWAMLAIMVVPVLLLIKAEGWPLWLRITLTVTAVIVAVLNAHWVHVFRTHTRLHLWCPLCRRDGRGDVRTPTPRPAPSGAH